MRKSMKSKQSGFSVLEIILVIAVVGLVGAVVWLFVNNQKPSEQKNTAVNQSTKTESKKPSKDDWLTYEPAGKEYSIRFADGWEMHKKGGDDTSLYSNGSLALQSGMRAKILDTVIPEGNASICRDGFTLDFLTYAYPKKYLTGEEEVIKSDNGTDIYKTVSHGNMFDAKDERVSYSYATSTSNSHVMIGYTKCTDSADEHETVEDVVRSLQLK